MCADQIEVRLNVYDLHPYNKYCYWMGLGAYHAGVEILGKEWSFGYLDNGGTGVYSIIPRKAVGVTFRESIPIGFCSYMRSQINSILARFEREFPGTSYNMFTNNCTTFCDKLCFSLTQQHIPSWVSRLGTLMGQFSCMVPRGLNIPPGGGGGLPHEGNGMAALHKGKCCVCEGGSSDEDDCSDGRGCEKIDRYDFGKRQELSRYGGCVCCCECHMRMGNSEEGEREGEDGEEEKEEIVDSNYISEDEDFDLSNGGGGGGDDIEGSHNESFVQSFEIYNLFPFTVGKTKHF